MDKYSRKRRCPKCDNAHVSTRFQDRGFSSGELLRTCRRCGYEWYEKALDTDSLGHDL